MAADPNSGGPSREIRVVETVEEIQELRHQVLSHYDQFKVDTVQKRNRLEDSLRYQLFRREANELESWLYEKLQAASDDSVAKDYTNLQAKIQKHQTFDAEVQSHYAVQLQLDGNGGKMIHEQHFAAEHIQVAWRRLIA